MSKRRGGLWAAGLKALCFCNCTVIPLVKDRLGTSADPITKLWKQKINKHEI